MSAILKRCTCEVNPMEAKILSQQRALVFLYIYIYIYISPGIGGEDERVPLRDQTYQWAGLQEGTNPSSLMGELGLMEGLAGYSRR